jgi:hypothetical protein
MNQSDQLSAILRTVAVKFEVSMDEILSPTRLRPVVYARHAYCYIAAKLLNAGHDNASFVSLQNIGRFINRDHTTVIHSSQKAAPDLIETDKKFSEVVNDCISLCLMATNAASVAFLDYKIAMLQEQLSILLEQRTALLTIEEKASLNRKSLSHA